MDMLRAIQTAASGLRAQSGRMRIVAENIANVASAAQTPGGEPYRRRIATFQSELDRATGARHVTLGRVARDPSEFQRRLEPGHPAADAEGYVRYPNVNSLVEAMDMREAQRSYEANLNVIGTSRRMIQRTIEILRG